MGRGDKELAHRQEESIVRKFVTLGVALALGLAVLSAQPAHAQACTQFVDNDITTSQTWTADEVWCLTGVRFVKDGATLTIEPGTLIRGEQSEKICAVNLNSCVTDADCDTGITEPCINDPGTLVVTRGSRVESLGNALAPVVFTNQDDDNPFANSEPDPNGIYATRDGASGVAATWGGVIMLGYGYVAKDTEGPPAAPNPAREVRIEGLEDRGRCTISNNNCLTDAECTGGADVCDTLLGFYGNCAGSAIPLEECDDDDSGAMYYTSIRYGGFELGSANEINGLTLGGVGRNTELDYIEIFNNLDDGVELFGGAANIKHFVISGVGDDSVDYDEGWRGNGQFLFVLQGKSSTGIPERGGEHDGGGSGDPSEPRAIPTIYNATYVGLGGVGATGPNVSDPFKPHGLKAANATFLFRDNAGGQYYNSAFLNFGGCLGGIEGGAAEAGTSGERSSTPYVAPSGFCSVTTSTSCVTDADCPITETCVLHFLPKGDVTNELEFEDDVWWCYGNPDPDSTGNPGFPQTPAGSSSCGFSTRDHNDPGVFSNPALQNQYLGCTAPLPIRELVRGIGPVGDPDPVETIDPLPASGSPLLTTDRFPPANGFFEPAPYKGAFRDYNWATGWTALWNLGYFPTPKQCDTSGNPCMTDLDCPAGESCVLMNTVVVNGDVTTSQTWTKDNEYLLTGVRFVKNGATLTIEPGTVVRGEQSEKICAVFLNSCVTDADCDVGITEPCINDPGTLVVTRGARVEANGTANLPIVFTNEDDDNVGPSLGADSGDYDNADDASAVAATWGGVIMLGYGYVAKDTEGPPAAPNPAREVRIEGLEDRGRCTISNNNCLTDAECTGGADVCDTLLGFYGNCAGSAIPLNACDDDSSGSLRFASIRYGGFELGSANEINGLTLGGVGRNTELDYIEIDNNLDDGVELFGGAANIKHFIITDVGDDSVDYDEGWRGNGQFLFVVQGKSSTGIPERGGEHDGGGSGDPSEPRAIPTIYNATYVGLGGIGASGPNVLDPFKPHGLKAANATFLFRDNAGGQYYNSAFLNFGGCLGGIEGGAAEAGTSGERSSTPYVAPSGFCSVTTSTSCVVPADCPGGETCVYHFLPKNPLGGNELEFKDDLWWCYGNPDPDATGSPSFPQTPAGSSSCGFSTRVHNDPGVISNPALRNTYLDCAAALPIRELVRGIGPVGDPDPIAVIDPRLAPGSPLLTTANTQPVPNNGFFTKANHKSAFRSTNWTGKWSNLSRQGVVSVCTGSPAVGSEPDEVSLGGVRKLAAGTQYTFGRVAQIYGVVRYDVLRSTDPSDFSAGTAICLETDDTDTQWIDPAIPAVGTGFYYLVRAVNPCGDGTLGYDSFGTERSGRTCP
jgi:hypothetical protein